MLLVVNLLLNRILKLFKLLKKILANYIIKSIIYFRVITNNYANNLYNIIIIKNRKKGILLMLIIIAFYYIKSK